MEYTQKQQTLNKHMNMLARRRVETYLMDKGIKASIKFNGKLMEIKEQHMTNRWEHKIKTMANQLKINEKQWKTLKINFKAINQT